MHEFELILPFVFWSLLQYNECNGAGSTVFIIEESYALILLPYISVASYGLFRHTINETTMGWFRSLNLTNKLLFAGVVAVIGFMVFASNDFSAFSAEVGYEPVQVVDAIEVNLNLSAAVVSSDGKSGSPEEGVQSGVYETFSVSGDLSFSTIGYEAGRRSYASLERKCIGNPTLYPEGKSADEIPGSDLYAIGSSVGQTTANAVLCGTPQEILAQMMNTESMYLETYELAPTGAGGTEESALENIGEGFGELVGNYVKNYSAAVVTDYQGGGVEGRGGAEVSSPISGSDDISQSIPFGDITVKEASTTTATITMPNAVYGDLYTLGNILAEDAMAFVPAGSDVAPTGGCKEGENFFACLGKYLGIDLGQNFPIDPGSETPSYVDSNFSMTVMTKNINDFNYSYSLGSNFLEGIKQIYGENSAEYSSCYTQYLSEGTACDEASVSESFSLWAEGSAYPLAEKNLYMQDYFMSIFDTQGIPINYISGPFVESFNVVGSINVSGSGVYNDGNDVNGKLFEVASRAPAKIYEQNVQLASMLSTDTMNYSRIPGYTCEFKGTTTNGWVTRDSDVSFTSEPITIVGSNVGPENNVSDDLSIKVGRQKAITKQMLLEGGYSLTIDGATVSLADALTTDVGIDKYRDVGPTLYSYGGRQYAAFVLPIGKEGEGKTRFAPFIAEISSDGTLLKLVAISDRASHTRAMQITSTPSGNLAILYQSKDGTCGGQDLSVCLYLAEYDTASGTVSTPQLINNSAHPAGYFTGLDYDPYTQVPVVVFHSWSGNTKTLYAASGENIVQFPDVLASDNVAEQFSFKIDSYGQRHLVIMEKGVMYHARWSDEEGGTLNGYWVESVPLPLATKGASVKLGDIDIFYESSTGIGYARLVIMYTVVPKEESGSSAVVFLVEDSPSDYWTVQADGTNTGVVGSVYRAYVIDQNAIVDWTADDIKRPFLEGKTISTKNGRVDATLGFGMFGWTVYVEDVTGYSATSRYWEKVYGDEYSFAYTTGGSDSQPVVVRAKDSTYYLGQEVTANLSSAYPPTSDSSTMSAGELMTLIDSSDLAVGVEVVQNKLPWLTYVDNVWETNPSKAACWQELKKYTAILTPSPSDYATMDRYTCQYDANNNPVGCTKTLEGGYATYAACSETCQPTTEPEIPIIPPTSGEICSESWCFTGVVHGTGVQKLSTSQIAKLTGVLMAQTGRSEPVAREQVVALCGIADEKNVSCPFMFAIWFQESSLNDNYTVNGEHLEFGCKASGYYESVYTQMLCAVDAAVENRGNDWDIALAEAISKEIASCLVASNHTCQSTNCSRRCIEEYMDDVFSLDICGEYCCSATTKNGYIIEKYTPNDSTPSGGNSDGRENLRAMLQILVDEGIVSSGGISMSPEVCRQ